MKPELNVDVVRELYIDQHLPVTKVAEQLNVPPSRVATFLKRNNIIKTRAQIVEDRKIHLIETYGVACSLQTDIAKEKSHETCLKKRGVEHHSQDPNVKQKKAETYKERYGVDHYSKTPEYLDKCAKTLSSKYGEGVAFPLQSSAIKEQKNRTMMEKYGTTSAVAIRWKRYYEEKAKREANENKESE